MGSLNVCWGYTSTRIAWATVYEGNMESGDEKWRSEAKFLWCVRKQTLDAVSHAIFSDTPRGEDHTFRSVKTHNHSLEADPSLLYDAA